jgi:hypothetical protein
MRMSVDLSDDCDSNGSWSDQVLGLLLVLCFRMATGTMDKFGCPALVLALALVACALRLLLRCAWLSCPSDSRFAQVHELLGLICARDLNLN